MSAVRVGLEAPVAAVALLGTSAGLDGCETIAVGLSDGRLALAQSVEDDLWEETLEVGLKTKRGARTGTSRARSCFKELVSYLRTFS